MSLAELSMSLTNSFLRAKVMESFGEELGVHYGNGSLFE